MAKGRGGAQRWQRDYTIHIYKLLVREWISKRHTLCYYWRGNAIPKSESLGILIPKSESRGTKSESLGILSK